MVTEEQLGIRHKGHTAAGCRHRGSQTQSLPTGSANPYHSGPSHHAPSPKLNWACGNEMLFQYSQWE